VAGEQSLDLQRRFRKQRYFECVGSELLKQGRYEGPVVERELLQVGRWYLGQQRQQEIRGIRFQAPDRISGRFLLSGRLWGVAVVKAVVRFYGCARQLLVAQQFFEPFT